jgi:hypothetical protein
MLDFVFSLVYTLFNLNWPSINNNIWCNVLEKIKDDFHSVLRISSAHNKGAGTPRSDINIAQILHLSNFF